jgi:hypothetical protein
VDLSLACSCGTVTGKLQQVGPAKVNRGVCYCDDCQSYAHFLGKPDQILDSSGGTEVFQMSPRHLVFDQGSDALRCVVLKGNRLLRWYTDCCRTPIGNTLSTAGVPFVGVLHNCVGESSDGRSPEEAIGPISARVFRKFAIGEVPRDGKGPLSMTYRFVGLLLGGRLRGDHKRSPFFDPKTRQPVVVPRFLTAEELAEVERARDRWAAERA